MFLTPQINYTKVFAEILLVKVHFLWCNSLFLTNLRWRLYSYAWDSGIFFFFFLILFQVFQVYRCSNFVFFLTSITFSNKIKLKIPEDAVRHNSGYGQSRRMDWAHCPAGGVWCGGDENTFHIVCDRTPWQHPEENITCQSTYLMEAMFNFFIF